MADVVVTLRIMPTSPEEDLGYIERKAKEKIKAFAGSSEFKVLVELVAFGLKSVNITFVMDENKGSTEALEGGINSINGVGSVEVTDVRRALG